MGKHVRKKKKATPVWKIIVLVFLILLLALMIWVAMLFAQTEIPEVFPTGTSAPSEEAAQSVETQFATIPVLTAAEQKPVELEQGLRIIRMDSYAGVYMEDGSDEIVSDVMMLIVENGAAQDLQLARIDVAYGDFTAEFEVTNLPAGEKVVVLEKNRHSSVSEEYRSVSSRNVVFFPEGMGLQEDRLEITGQQGSIDVKNISETDVAGDIYVYYKNSASDILYGGITYRAKIENGLAVGETKRVLTGHYSPDNCTVVMVTCGE